MKTELADIDTLMIDPANVRTHSPRNVEAVKASLAKFGQRKPIVVGQDNVVQAGSGTLQAARELGWKKITTVRSPLKGAEAIAYSISDNRTAELADWDYEELAAALRGLEGDVDLVELGWGEGELENLLAAEWTPPETEPMPGTEPERSAVPPVDLTAEQRRVLDRAVEKCRESEGDDLTEGACVEIICTRYLED